MCGTISYEEGSIDSAQRPFVRQPANRQHHPEDASRSGWRNVNIHQLKTMAYKPESAQQFSLLQYNDLERKTYTELTLKFPPQLSIL
ncbi:hypothetical protein Trydic_g21617 [Trypoxylus dichotomus]